jgi:DNA polymerase-3 subunit delta
MPSDSILVIVNEKSSDVLKGVKAVQLVECGKSDATTIARWVKGQCVSSGIGIELETAKLLAVYCSLDMNRVQNETAKLIAYSLESKLITTADVEALVNKDVEYKIYELTDCIGKKQFDGALAIIEDMLSKGETMQRLLINIYFYFRRLLHVAISTQTDLELAKTLGVQEFLVKMARSQAKHFTKRALKKAVDILTDTEYLIKRGAVQPDNSIWLNIFSIMVEGE